MAEWSNAPDSKSGVQVLLYRGFESLPFRQGESPLNRPLPKAGLQVVDPVEFFGRMRVRGIQVGLAMPYRLRLETAIVLTAPDRDEFELEPYCGRLQARRPAEVRDVLFIDVPAMTFMIVANSGLPSVPTRHR